MGSLGGSGSILALQRAPGKEKGDLDSAMGLPLPCSVTLGKSPCPLGLGCLICIMWALAWLPALGTPSSHAAILE